MVLKAAAKSVLLGRKNLKKVPQNPGGTDTFFFTILPSIY